MASRAELMAFSLPWQAAGAVGQSLSSGVSAAGTNQATGTALTSSINLFSTVSNGQGATLPSANAQPIHAGYNGGANTLSVYCASGEKMNNTTNGSIQVPAGKGYILVPHINQWVGIISG